MIYKIYTFQYEESNLGIDPKAFSNSKLYELCHFSQRL